LGADWKLCCYKLKLERGEFFHEIYRIEQKLGRTFRELQPHALFPVDEYFNGTGRYDKQSMDMLDSYDLDALSDGYQQDDDGEIPPFRKVLRFPIKRAA
jgi:hypothetical protein